MSSDAQKAATDAGSEPSAKRPDLAAFRASHPLVAMKNPGARYKNDCVMISASQGLLHLERPPGHQVQITDYNKDGDINFLDGRYLWVVTAEDGLHALESRGSEVPVGNGRLKHSNLTAGGSAHGGGEMWYWKNSDTIFVNAHSGRYGTRDASGVKMAQALVDALKNCGFNAATTGIEEETNCLRAYPEPNSDLEN